MTYLASFIVKLLVLMGFYVWVPDNSGVVTWYGLSGWTHAAQGQGKTPFYCPKVVTNYDLGVAAPSRFQFGTWLRVTSADGRQVIVVVLDRMGNDWPNTYDLWPAAARHLGMATGEMDDPGSVLARVEVLHVTGGVVDHSLRLAGYCDRGYRWPVGYFYGPICERAGEGE